MNQYDLNQSMNSQINQDQGLEDTLEADIPGDIDVGDVHFTANYFNGPNV